jgi:hypothetical protein
MYILIMGADAVAFYKQNEVSTWCFNWNFISFSGNFLSLPCVHYSSVRCRQNHSTSNTIHAYFGHTGTAGLDFGWNVSFLGKLILKVFKFLEKTGS